MTDEDLLLSKLFSRMNNDCIKDIVFSDNIIKRYSALRIDALGEESDHKINDMHRVSQGARTLARLLKEVKKSHCEIEGFSDLLTPKHFDIVVKTAKEMTFESTSQPLSLARFLGNLLGHAIQVKAGLAIRDNANEKLEEALNFQKLFESEWNCRVNSAAQKKINNLKRNTIQTIPLTNDLKTLLEYIKMKMAEKIQSLKDTKKSRDWCDLAALTLCRLIMFNKRRRAEVKDLKVKDYEDRPDWTKQGAEEFEDSMSTTDRIVYKRMDMVISAGKSRKNVDAYVLLPPDGKEAIELLIKTREAVGIPSSNQFIFARLNADTPLNGTQELKQICSLCPGLQYPERINSRNLRKYISTVCQIMDMSEKEVEQLARHLGHNVKTHKEFYRLAHSTVELSKVSQLLMAVERGEVNKWQGKCLNDISIEEFPAFENREDGKVSTSYDSDDATMETATSDDQCRDGILTSTNESECASNINDCEAMETAIPQNSCDDVDKAGCSVVLRKKFSASEFWSDCRKHNVTIFPYIGEMLRYLLAQPKSELDGVHKLRGIVGNGLRKDIWEKAVERFKIPFIGEIYAATEGLTATINVFGKPGAVGRLSPFYSRLDPDKRSLVKYDHTTFQPIRDVNGRCTRVNIGEPGLMLSKVPDYMKGTKFYKADAETNEKKLVRDVFVPGDCFMNYGDSLVLDKEYFLYFYDRLGDSFRWKGNNVSTTEVANVITSLSFVEDANVYGVSIPDHDGKAGMVAINLTAEAKLNPKELRELYIHVNKELPKYACPLFVRHIPEAALTGTFKNRKVDFAQEGYDLSKVDDPMYFSDHENQTYSPLNDATLAKFLTTKL